MELTTVTTAANLELEGVWRKFEDAEFLIAGANSPKWQRALRRHGASVSSSKLKNDIPTQENLVIQAMADAILLDWRGNVTMKAKKLAPTRENKIVILSIPTMRNWITDQMNDIANFQQEEAKAEDAEAK